MLRSSVLRASNFAAAAPTFSKTVLARHVPAAGVAGVQSRSNSNGASGYAVSNVTLTDIEKRWETMAPAEQAELWMQLRDRMKGSWSELTLQEKKASYYIAFGPHGPRALPPPGEGKKVFGYTIIGIIVSFVAFWAIRQGGRPAPKTMSKEWQEASNQYLKEQNVEPITGVSSEGYKGPGMVQSS